jgi:hypothetical protein
LDSNGVCDEHAEQWSPELRLHVKSEHAVKSQHHPRPNFANGKTESQSMLRLSNVSHWRSAMSESGQAAD